jgi:TRAP-type C4-dicarboxylate transport system permease small subunit
VPGEPGDNTPPSGGTAPTAGPAWPAGAAASAAELPAIAPPLPTGNGGGEPAAASHHGHYVDPTRTTGGGALGALDRVLHRIEKGTALVSGLGIFALMLLGVVHVLGRKFFNFPVFGYIDIVEIMMAFLVFLGIAYTERLGGHIRMELLVTQLKQRWVALFELIGVLLGLVIVGIITWYSWQHAMRAYVAGDSTIDAQISLWWSKMVIPIALALLWLRLLVSVWAYLRLAIDPSSPPVAVAEILTPEEQALRDAASAGAFDDAPPGAAPARAAQHGGSR